jgi:ribosomal-protein-alanine N-acetyltransferase
VNIRPAIAADIPFMMGLERQCPTAAHWTEQQYQKLFQSEGTPERFVLVMEEADQAVPRALNALGGVVAGFLVARHLAPEWELENVVVAVTARRQGIARQLLDQLLAQARNTRSDSVFLEVRESNSAARALYEKAGFQQTSLRKDYYTHPSDNAILYRRRMP